MVYYWTLTDIRAGTSGAIAVELVVVVGFGLPCPQTLRSDASPVSFCSGN